MNVSAAGLEFIKQHEGCRLQAYQDGAGIWTIGYGETHDVHPGMTITQDQADAWLIGYVDTCAEAVNAALKVPVSQNQFDALVDFSYNLGANALLGSHLLLYLNEGRVQMAADEFPRWVHDANGSIEPGLVTRRADERRLFLS